MSTFEKWAASLLPQVEQARDALRARKPAQVAAAAGATLREEQGQSLLELKFFGEPYTVCWPDIKLRDAKGKECSTPSHALLLQYLRLADGTPLEGEWVSLRNLPNGAFYEQAFQSYSGNMAAREFAGDRESFCRAAREAGGEGVDLGDAAFRFQVFPRVPVAVVFWSGGGEFPDSIQVLFDATACHYNHLETLAYLGSLVCKRIIAKSGRQAAASGGKKH